MADFKLSELSEILDSTGGYLYIIVPDGLGGWDFGRITASTFLQSSDDITQKEVNISSDFEFVAPASSLLRGIRFQWLSGSPKIKVGTTPGGTEISLVQHNVPNSDYLNLMTINKNFTTATTVYISVSGGAVNFNIDYKENDF